MTDTRSPDHEPRLASEGRFTVKGGARHAKEIAGLEAMLIRDNKRMREAGTKLAEAALRVIGEYDGLHRLSLAVAEWATAVANEGDRPFIQGEIDG